MAEIVLDGVEKVYAGDVPAVTDVSLVVESGEFLVLVGPSGCGKSTLLRMIAGLEEVTGGSISIGGRQVTQMPAGRRDIAMVFQSYALYPHMTVRDNLGYGLRVRKTSKDEVRRRVDEVASLLGLEDLLDRKPAALSGGQRQRVAMGRAIVREPQAFLMDEPLSNLDAKLRVTMRAELSRLHERLGVTTVYVTHDQVEAMTLGQRVVVMRDGRIQQIDTPQAIYRAPANLFVAAFIGSPSMNLVQADVQDGAVEFAGYRVPLDPERRPPDGRVVLGIRPEDIQDVAFSEPGLPTLEVDVAVVEELGAELHAIFGVDAEPVDVEALSSERDDARLLREGGNLFTARIDARSAATAGTQLQVTVDPRRFHFFDADTGESLLSVPALAAAG
jgi:multiple sugar transport system ATP-binding protein